MFKKYLIGGILVVVIILGVLVYLNNNSTIDHKINPKDVKNLPSLEFITGDQDLRKLVESGELQTSQLTADWAQLNSQMNLEDIYTEYSLTPEQLEDLWDASVWMANYGDPTDPAYDIVASYVDQDIHNKSVEEDSSFWTLEAHAQGAYCNITSSGERNCYNWRPFTSPSISGDDHRVNIHDVYVTNTDEVYNLIKEATVKSDNVYSGIDYTIPKLSYYVKEFPAGDDSVDGETLMDAAFDVVTDRCTINIYPPSFTQALTEPAKFKQTIAHEIFHCLQGVYYPEQELANWAVADWWGEGSAEFFGGYVYPQADFEDEFNEEMDINSRDNTLHKMSYENYMFFQGLYNEGGIDLVKDFLGDISSSSNLNDHVIKTSKYPKIELLFESINQDYLTNDVVDISGKYKEFRPWYAQENIITVTNKAEETFESNPFQYGRYQLNIIPTTIPREVTFEHKNGEGSLTFWDQDTEEWGEDIELPVIVSCNEYLDTPTKNYIVSVVNTAGDGEVFTTKMSIDSLTDSEFFGERDDNLIGVWKPSSESMENFFNELELFGNELAANYGSEFDVILNEYDATGCFLPDNTYLMNFVSRYTVTGSGADLLGGGAFETIGAARGIYTADGETITYLEQEFVSTGNLTVVVPELGFSQSFPFEPKTTLTTEPFIVPYSITNDNLETAISYEGVVAGFNATKQK